jgi:hypothetical protein
MGLTVVLMNGAEGGSPEVGGMVKLYSIREGGLVSCACAAEGPSCDCIVMTLMRNCLGFSEQPAPSHVMDPQRPQLVCCVHCRADKNKQYDSDDDDRGRKRKGGAQAGGAAKKRK